MTRHDQRHGVGRAGASHGADVTGGIVAAKADLLAEAREKVIVGRTAAGAVREFQLRLRYRFRLRSRTGKELIPDTEIVLYRTPGAISRPASLLAEHIVHSLENEGKQAQDD